VNKTRGLLTVESHGHLFNLFPQTVSTELSVKPLCISSILIGASF